MNLSKTMARLELADMTLIRPLVTFIAKASSFRKADGGIAAIETALLLPVLMVLYVGMLDLTDLITHNRKVTQATDIIASLAAENNGSITMVDAQDYFSAVDMVMSATGNTDTRADLKGFRRTVTNATTGAFTISKIWTATKSSGGCNVEPPMATLTALTAQGNDVIVASVCTYFAPTIASILGTNVIGKTSFTLLEQIAVRPRTTAQLSCKMSATNTAACPAT
jgi:Flp pilus assembly protein TadG